MKIRVNLRMFGTTSSSHCSIQRWHRIKTFNKDVAESKKMLYFCTEKSIGEQSLRRPKFGEDLIWESQPVDFFFYLFRTQKVWMIYGVTPEMKYNFISRRRNTCGERNLLYFCIVWIRPGLRILPNDYVMAANRQAVASSLAAGATARKKKGAWRPFFSSIVLSLTQFL